MSTSTATPQQINVADLQLPQLAEVKRQLEEVKPLCSLFKALTEFLRLGTLAPDQLLRSTEASAVEIPVVHRKRKGDKAREQRYCTPVVSF